MKDSISYFVDVVVFVVLPYIFSSPKVEEMCFGAMREIIAKVQFGGIDGKLFDLTH